MKPRISNLLRPLRYYSQVSSGPFRLAQKLSLAVTGKPSKDVVIKALREHVDRSTDQFKPQESSKGDGNSTVILASRDFATWLEDESFMSEFLKSLYQSRGLQTRTTIVDVLSGATDSLGSQQVLGHPRRGFSVLYGSDKLLPDLWGGEAAGSSSRSDPERAASVTFSQPPSAELPRSLDFTVPLANTVFQNGRRSTLFATRWELSSSERLAPTRAKDKQHQAVHCLGAGEALRYSNVPLLPLAPPRKIVAGLGNIVRQVEVDNAAVPASKELEALIPRLFEKRAQRDADAEQGPIGIWTWVIPARVFKEANLAQLRVFRDNEDDNEADLALSASDTFRYLLSSGCRLHKILSGGGGWGAKQGLLSIDPETSYNAPESEDIEMFIKSFQERNSEDPTEGLVTPGSYLLFCAEPLLTESVIAESERLNRGYTFGVIDRKDQDAPTEEGEGRVEVIADNFSAASATGLYLASQPGDHQTGQTLIATKIDTPRSILHIN